MGPIGNDVLDLDDDLPAAGGSGVVVETGAAVVVNEDNDLVGELPARAIRNPDRSVTLPLTLPVSLVIRSAQRGDRTEEFKALTFHRLNGADIRAVQAASESSRSVVVLARSTRIRESIMNALYDRMDGADIVDAGAVIDTFFPTTGRKTGRST